MRRRLSAVLALIAIALPAGGAPAWAQEARAALGARVTDAQGAVVPNAEVVVTSDETTVNQHTSRIGAYQPCGRGRIYCIGPSVPARKSAPTSACADPWA